MTLYYQQGVIECEYWYESSFFLRVLATIDALLYIAAEMLSGFINSAMSLILYGSLLPGVNICFIVRHIFCGSLILGHYSSFKHWSQHHQNLRPVGSNQKPNFFRFLATSRTVFGVVWVYAFVRLTKTNKHSVLFLSPYFWVSEWKKGVCM